MTPFDDAVDGDWEAVWKVWFRIRKRREGVATNDVNQIRWFFEAGPDVLWVTFSGGFLRWCFARSGVRPHPDGQGFYRETVDGWHNTDLKGARLLSERLAGSLLKVQGFQGTICEIREFEYLKRKLNGQLLPEVESAIRAENQMVQTIVPLMRRLTWQDFETLVDLVFANSGWRRLGRVGGSQKTVDIELMLPTIEERAFVQIKSKATRRDLAKYLNRLRLTGVRPHVVRLAHRDTRRTCTGRGDVTLIGPDRLARMVLNSGLAARLREKVS